MHPPTASGVLPPTIGTPSVLIAHGDLQLRQGYRVQFETAGWTVLESADGRDALAKALTTAPSLVVLDAELRYIDGCSLCELLRRDGVTAAAPILLVTNDGIPMSEQRARQAGANAVLAKPASSDRVLEMARALISQAASAGSPAGDTLAAPAPAESYPRSDAERRHSLSKSFPRFDTTTPPAAPPALMCPSCDRSLTYNHSHVGGVSERHREQWDYYSCPTCGATLQYRQRTRKLRRVQ